MSRAGLKRRQLVSFSVGSSTPAFRLGLATGPGSILGCSSGGQLDKKEKPLPGEFVLVPCSRSYSTLQYCFRELDWLVEADISPPVLRRLEEAAGCCGRRPPHPPGPKMYSTLLYSTSTVNERQRGMVRRMFLPFALLYRPLPRCLVPQALRV